VSTASSGRNPLVIRGNNVSSGDRSATFAAGSPESLLRSYLILVRDLRGQRREPSIELRSDDIAVIARHLRASEELVLGGLLDLMGVTRAERGTMMAMLAAGALTLVLTGSFVSDLSSDGVSVEMVRLADAVQAAATGSVDGGAGAATSSTGGAAGPVRFQEVARPTPTPDVLRSAAEGTAAPAPVRDVTASTDAAISAAATESWGIVAQEPVSIGFAPDGSLVASVAPPVPVPPAEEQVATTELPDGTTVGVAAPPVPPPPPAEQVATTELPDGTTVGVAAPPVPPATDG
jgi:hypothetical protein